MSGNAAERVAVVIPSARKRPLRTCGTVNAMLLVAIIATRPASVSMSPGAVPLYGTWVRRICVMLANSSMTRCGLVP